MTAQPEPIQREPIQPEPVQPAAVHRRPNAAVASRTDDTTDNAHVRRLTICQAPFTGLLERHYCTLPDGM